MPTQPGSFVISLDLELNWGMFDAVTPGSYDDNILGVHEVTPKILQLFQQYDIAATWAVVGMLLHKNIDELQTHAPSVQPQYIESWRSTYVHADTEHVKQRPELYFAPALLKKIIQAPNQEIASHTYSHYYCVEKQTDLNDNAWAADCAAMRRIAAQSALPPPTSLVFPRNQWSLSALAIAKKHNITAFRGTEQHWLYRPRTQQKQRGLLMRLGRLIDSYLPISGHQTATPHMQSGLINIPASRFLRPYSKTLRGLETLRLRRITQSMTYAAKNGLVFHLWWHPHNFGVNQIENLNFLERILQHYTTLQRQYGMRSVTMQQIATHELATTAATTEAN